MFTIVAIVAYAAIMLKIKSDCLDNPNPKKEPK